MLILLSISMSIFKNNLIERRNKEILDSIRYASRLQTALLPNMNYFKAHLENSFIFYRPKEAVSGDFYWFQEKEGYKFFAVVDCTGHGVPGAMVSIVGQSGLNRCVNEFQLDDPGEILDKLTQLVKKTFSHSTCSIMDGMDMSICVLHPDGKTLKYAGANNPLWIVNKDGILTFKADKQPVGCWGVHKPFTTHTVSVEPNDLVVLFTDGYADQFGGERNKRYKTPRFKKLLLRYAHLPMNELNDVLIRSFDSWRGDEEQLDDVCVMGIRL